MKPAQPSPRVSVIVPTFNGLEHLERLLPSLVAHSPENTELIVVNDAGTDDSVSWLATNFPRVLVVDLAANGGTSNAFNEGLKVASGSIICALNNDTEVLPGWIEAAIAHFDDQSVGSVAPLVEAMHDPGIVDSAGMRFHACGWSCGRAYRQPLGACQGGAVEVFGAPFNCCFLRREALDKVGPQPVEFVAYYEDTDLAFRLRWAGYRCIFEPASRLLHAGSSSYGKTSPRVTRFGARNEELVFWANLPRRTLMLALLPHLGFQAIRLVRHAMTGRLDPFIQGKVEAWRMRGWIRERRRFAQTLAPEGRAPVLCLDWSWRYVGHGVTWLRKQRMP